MVTDAKAHFGFQVIKLLAQRGATLPCLSGLPVNNWPLGRAFATNRSMIGAMAGWIGAYRLPAAVLSLNWMCFGMPYMASLMVSLSLARLPIRALDTCRTVMSANAWHLGWAPASAATKCAMILRYSSRVPDSCFISASQAA
jgi:hypothetical protein